MVYLRFLVLTIVVLLQGQWTGPARAGKAHVVFAKAERGARNLYRFTVTVRHGDTGWKHYADRWEILDPHGKILGVRILMHPHENEQPFTRSLGGVKLPKNLPYVTLRAHDLKHGLGGKEFKLKLK